MFKHFFIFIASIFVFLVYNEVTVRILAPIVFDSLAPVVQVNYWFVPWMIGNALILVFGFLFGIMSAEEFESYLYPDKEPAWFWKFLLRFDRDVESEF